MTIFRSHILAGSALVAFVSGLATPFAAHANQGQGELAQYPLSITNVIQPAMVMVFDDSGSMRFQTLFRGRDGGITWGGNNSFFLNSGLTREAPGTGDRYIHIAPAPYPRQAQGAGNAAIPPLDQFGFARSHQYNGAYFDPYAPPGTYLPWKNQDGSSYPAAVPTAARINPNSANPNLNLTADVELYSTAQATDSRFRIRPGMVIPAGTRYRPAGNCGLHAPNTDWRSRTNDQTVTGTCEIGIGYFPATFYLRTDSPLPAGYVAANRVLVEDACGIPGSGCNMYRYEIKPGNYSTTAAYQAAIQSFANWFTYYNARDRALVSGATNAMVDINNMRVSYMTINDFNSWNNPVGQANNRLPVYDMANEAQRTTLFDQIQGLNAGGTTPNLSAVRAAGEQFRRTDANAPVQLACQRNAVMLFTDGFTNQGGLSGFGNVDGDMGAPFADTHSNTMADIATYYYLNSNLTVGDEGVSRLNTLQPAGQVPVPTGCDAETPDPRLNCQSNLHANFYAITLAATGEILDPSDPIDPFTTPVSWPSYSSNTASTIDDLWHATINTRGEYIAASTPAEVTTALRRILAAVGGGESPSGSVALTGARVGDGAFTVVPSFESRNEGTDWFGRLEGYTLELSDTGGFDFAFEWDASGSIPPAGSRNILFATPAGGGGVNPNVALFSAANLGNNNTARLNRICSNDLAFCSPGEINALGATVNQVVDYLRGDQTLSNSGQLRQRTTRLGDIVNSNPVIADRTDDFGYRSLRPATAGTVDPLGYQAYLEAKASSARPRMVYVGANDGMLHAFNADDLGRELFAFMPSTAVGHLGNLVFPYDPDDNQDQKFQHRYYVDGPVAVSDARFGANWRTALVATTGAGGKSVFALDVTNPESFVAGNVLWEITPTTAGDAGQFIGNVLSKPLIVPVREAGQTRWKAIFGNGYDSAAGQAALFVVDLQTGATNVIPAVEAVGPDVPGFANGLGAVVAIDRYDSVTGPSPTAGTDGLADTVYGADLHGNVWKFDLTTSTVAYGNSPLFTAVDAEDNRQPITGGLEVAAGPGGGVMVYFGTGSFSFRNDAVDTSLQSLYGILDSGSAVEGRDELLQQSITGSADTEVRNISGNSVNFIQQSGWYIDLAVQVGGEKLAIGERSVGQPRLSEGTLFFPTFEPGGTNAQADPCAPGGQNWLYAINALNGGAAMSGLRLGSPDADPLAAGSGAVRLRDAGQSPVRDVAVALVPQLGAVDADATPDEIAAALAQTCDKVITTAGGFVAYQARACGRQSWRQIR